MGKYLDNIKMTSTDKEVTIESHGKTIVLTAEDTLGVALRTIAGAIKELEVKFNDLLEELDDRFDITKELKDRIYELEGANEELEATVNSIEEPKRGYKILIKDLAQRLEKLENRVDISYNENIKKSLDEIKEGKYTEVEHEGTIKEKPKKNIYRSKGD